MRFLEVSREELLTRLMRRNAAHGTFNVDESQLNLYFSWFQPATADEL